jgi:outer membrane protein assembly complex protein YaeT
MLLPAAQAMAAPLPEEADPPRVDELRFSGVEAVTEKELRERLETAEPPFWGLLFWREDPLFEDAALEEDLVRIAEIYREHGYFEASASSELELDESGKRVAVEIHVVEGEPVRLEQIDVTLADPSLLAPDLWEEALRAISLSEGQIFGTRDYARARAALVDRLAEAGHPAAVLEGGAEVELEHHAARLLWKVDPGPAVRFGELRLVGLERVAPELVMRELVFAPGDAYALGVQRKSELRLRDTELFRSVAIRPRPPAASTPEAPAAAPQVWPMEVQLRERPPRSISLSAGYGTEEKIRARAAWRHRNFLGGARKLELAGEYSSLIAGGSIRFLQPRFIDPELKLEVTTSFARETVPAYDAWRLDGRFELQRPISGPWSGRGGYAIEFANVTKVRADDPGEEGRARVSSLFAGLRRSTLDDRLVPRRGTWLDLYAEPTLEPLGASASYLTLVAEGRAFWSWREAVLGSRLRFGAIQPMLGSASGDVPIFRRFFAGGSTSVRGYGYQDVGPQDDGDPVGGLTLVEASLELRFPLFWRLGGVAFLDAGQISRGTWSFGAPVRFGAGPGLRLRTPVGPVRVDVGFPLNPRRGDDTVQVYFSVGHAF